MALAPIGPHSTVLPGQPISSEDIYKTINEIIARAPEEVILTARRVVLNIDEDYLEHILRKMDKNQIDLFIKHIQRAKLLAEKILIDLA
jgi:hypothetical protein